MTGAVLRVVLLSVAVAYAVFSGALAGAQDSAGPPSASSAHAKAQDAVRLALQDGAQLAPGARLAPGATILSDTMGVDFNDYIRRMHNDIQRNWAPLVPQEVQAPLMKKGAVGIRFTILPDGTIGSMKLEAPSGDVQLDKAAWYAITSEGKFPPLPSEYRGPRLDLRVGFFYNSPVAPPQASASK